MPIECNATTAPDLAPRSIRHLRQSKRRGHSIAVNLIADGVVSHVTLENVSTTGMGLRGWSDLTCARDVQIQLPDGRPLAATVCWVGKGRMGLKLVERLQNDDPLLQDGGLVRFPEAQPVQSAAVPTRQVFRLGNGAKPTAIPKILIAEPFRSVGLLLKGILEKAGHAVDIVEDGLALVEAARVKAYDLVLIDSQTPLMSSSIAAAKIRQLPAPFGLCSIIAMAGEASSVGFMADAHLVKPIRPRALLEQVAAIQAQRGFDAMSELVARVSNAA
jgi:CheY-like chemotaxis protein